MKSHQTSVGKKFPFYICVVLSLGFLVIGAMVGCTNVQKDGEGGASLSSGAGAAGSDDSSSDEASAATEEVTLREDMTTIEDLRKNIPEQKRKENDELKEVLSLLGEVKRPPAEHRDKFNRTMRKLRERRQREMTKTRDNFNKNEREKREDFLKELGDARDKFNKKRNTSARRKSFYDEQDTKRREFFADERDARREFESEIRQQDADFNAFYREKTDDFNKELRVYTQSYQDLQKQLKERDGSRGK